MVLHQLTKAPFEPLRNASLKDLTFKTVFLLALASGKRQSEIHAWLLKNVRYQDNGTKVSLTPSARFLSKNQLAKEGPESVAPVIFPSLAATLDRSLADDRTLMSCQGPTLLSGPDKEHETAPGVSLYILQERF